MESMRTVEIWDIKQLLLYYNRHRLIFDDADINKQVIKDIFTNHSIGNISMYHYLDKNTGNSYFKLLKGEQEVSSIINYYLRNKDNWSWKERSDFLLFQFSVEIIYEWEA